MPSTRIPWWIYLIALSFSACFLVGFVYLPISLPQGPGFTTGFSGQAEIGSVTPGSLADKEGLKPGDVIVRVGGRPVRNPGEYSLITTNLAANQETTMGVRRGNQEFEVPLVLRQQEGHPFGGNLLQPDAGLIPLARGIFLVVSFLEVVLGLFVLFKRPADLMAVSAGVFLCLVGAQSDLWTAPGGAVAFRQLPRLIQWVSLPAIVISTPWTVGALFFSLTFPCLAFRKRWAWWGLGIVGALILGCFGFLQVAAYYDPPLADVRWAGLLALTAIFGSGVALVAAFIVLLLNLFKRRAANERRRVRLVIVGLIAWVGCFVLIALVSIILPKRFSFITSSPVQVLSALSSIPFPICVAYAVLKDRLFDVSIVIRQSLQYAVARGALLIPIPILAGILIADVIRHQDQSLGTLLSTHGWAYLCAGIVGVVAHKKQKQWLAALDRRFYREHYNAQQLLRETVEEIRSASTLAEVAPKVVVRIAQALHPEFVAVLMREAREATYRSAAAEPAGVYPKGLSADSKLMSAFRLFAKPLQISLAESGWLKQQLPTEDTNFLREAKIDLMVPIASAPEGREALLVLGPKKSEEPYSAEDRELLSAIGSALALLLERPASAARSAGLEECPQCGLCYESGMGRCANEGARLTFTPIPRLLTSRYRLERRLGRGGMGTVYKATDTSLERAVAVKVIREDLVTSAEAAERFRREAKAAAAFSHPNLVTVHDFGVDAETRVFLVMELLEGETLRQLVQAKKTIAPEYALAIIGGVCAGLEMAHAHGMVHRDMKPENIFLAKSADAETPKILDFGLAKFLQPQANTAMATMDTASGVLVGTPQYMSPEQLKGEAATAHWDLWALGVIAYEMLLGVHPFAATTVAQTHSAIITGRYEPLAKVAPEAPQPWAQFFASVLNMDASARPQTAKLFLAAFEKALQKHANVSG